MGDVSATIKLSDEELKALRDISRTEHLTDESLIRKFILDGIHNYKLEKAIKAYEKWLIALSEGSESADLPIREFMMKLSEKDIKIDPGAEMHEQSLKYIVDKYGSSNVKIKAEKLFGE
jgi:predicted HTH domain antitoxin